MKKKFVKWKPYIRVDQEDDGFYVMISDDIGEQNAHTVYTTKADAETEARKLAKWSGWQWGVNC